MPTSFSSARPHRLGLIGFLISLSLLLLGAPAHAQSAATTVNDTDSGFTYTGTGWFYNPNRGAGDFQDDVHATPTNGDSASYSFTGTSVSYVTETNTDEGNVQVFLDGTLQATVNCNSTRKVQQAVWSKTGLPSGSHTLKLVKQDGQYMLVDAVQVTAAQTAGAVNDTDPSLAYTGSSWFYNPNRGIGDYQDDVHATPTNGDSVSYPFTGTGISVITEINTDEGNVQVLLDGTLQATVSAYSATRKVQQAVWSKSGLASGAHTLKLVKQDGGYMLLDALQVQAAAAPTPTPYSGTAVSVAASGTTKVEAENYDKGGEGVAYHDTDSGVTTAYRPDNIGVYAGSSASNGYSVGNTAGGEWDGYTLNVATAGVYVPTAFVGSPYAGGTFHLEFGPVGQVGGAGVTQSAQFTVPNTGGYTTFQPVSVPGVSLPAGLLWMRLVLDSAYPGNFDAFTLAITGGIIYGAPSSISTGATDVPPPGWADAMVPTDSGSDAEGEGPSDGFSVSLPSGASEDSPGPDLWSYNPLGPSASYSRLYRSKHAAAGYASPGLSAGWTDNYDLSVTFNGTNTYTFTYDNGAQELWTGTTGALTPPNGSPYTVVETTPNGAPAFITVTDKSRTKTTFTQFATAAGNYPANTFLLTGITNLVGRSITINRDTGNANGHRITSIVNDAATAQALLSFAYSGSQIASVTDTVGGRQASYTFGSNGLATVSQIAASGPSSPLMRWQYGYTPLSNQPYLTSILCPDPSTPGSTIPAYVDYYDTGTTALVSDASGTVHSYSYGNPVQVQATNTALGLTETHQQKFAGSSNVDMGAIDALNHQTSVSYGGSPSPYLPSAFTNRNSQISSVTYDFTGAKYGNVGTTEDPRTDQMLLGYLYPTDFPLGEVTSVQESNLTTSVTKQATTMTYYGLSDGAINGLVKQVNTPTPDTVNGTSTVPTTYAYTLPVFSSTVPAAGGQPSQVSEPGNPTFPTITTKYNYTSDGSTFVQNESLGEPITVTDNLNEVTHFRYDGRGNLTSVMDASGNVTQFTYNLADQRTSVIYPATGAQGSGNAHTDTIYQYVGGPVQNVIVYDEAGTAVREVDYTYTREGMVASVKGSTQPASYTYDERYRVLTQTDGNSNTTRYDYDTVGNLYHTYYPNKNMASGYDILSYLYDADQNLAQEVDGRGVTTTYTRTDPESLVTQVAYSTLPAGVTAIAPVNYAYDDFGRRHTMYDGTSTSPVSYNYLYGYDDLDEMLSQTVSFPGGPQNQTLAYSHNSDGSRLALTWPTNVTNGVGGVNLGKTNYAYDGVGRLTQAKFPWSQGIWNHAYLSNGWLSGTNGPKANGSVFPLVQTNYGYNARGFLTSLRDNTAYNDPYGAALGSGDTNQIGPAYSLKYDALGNKAQEIAVLPALSYESVRYDAYGNPYGVKVTLAQDASHTLNYGYDSGYSSAAQNRDVMTGEMSAVSGTGTSGFNTAYSHGFGYDPAYNPTTYGFWNTGAGADQSYSPLTFNIDNQYTTGDFGLNWLYDGSGNPTTYKSATFGFDPEDRLTSISSPAFSAAYDGDGLRIRKTTASGTTYFLYDGGSLIAEESYSNAAASFKSLNGWTADGWRTRYDESSSQAYCFAFDPQGNLVQRQNPHAYAAGAGAYDETIYEGYGALRQDAKVYPSAVAQYDPVGFGGQFGYYTDTETGLLCLTHRYYDPGTGKFINRDPIGYAGGENLYGFADGNPVNESDPSGDQGTPTMPEPEKSDEGRDVAEDNPLQWIIDMNEMRRAQELRRSQGEAAATEFFSNMKAGNLFGDGKSVMSDLEVALLRDQLKPKGISIELGTPGAEARLPILNRDAGEFNPAQRTIYLHSNPTRSAVYEEVYHAYQFLRDGRSDVARSAPGRPGVSISAQEYEAKTFLLRNRHHLGIPNSESRTTLQHLWRLHHGYDQN